MLRMCAWAAALVMMLAAAGCGGGGTPEEQAADTAVEYAKAIARKDGEKACAMMTSDAKEQLVAAGAFLGGGDCPKLVGAVVGMLDSGDLAKLREAEAGKVTVTGDTALVESGNGGDPMQLRRVKGEWLVDVDPEDETDTIAESDDEPSTADEDPTFLEDEEDEPAAPATTVDVGESLTQDDYQVTVLDVTRAKRLPGDEFTDPVKADGEFVILKLRVKNTGKKVATFDDGLVQLADVDGTVYSASTGGAEEQIMALPDYIDERAIQPKSTETGNLAFDIPKAANVDAAQFASSIEDFFDAQFTGAVQLP
jgi:hypothetical protein